MRNTLVLILWELKRITRSRKASLALLIAPLVSLAVILPTSNRGYPIAAFFPAVAAGSAWLFLLVRAYNDRLTGFAMGVHSTPAAGAAVFVSRLTLWLALSALQCVLFHIGLRFLP